MTDTVHVNGIDIAYRFDGAEGAPVVTLSNSLASDLGMWEAQVEALAPRHRVLRYDTRGHGRTSAPEGSYSMGMLVADLLGLWDSLGIERSAFCGLSLGGMIGQQLGIEHGRRLAGLVLCDTIARWPEGTSAIWDERIATAELRGMAPLVEGTIERWFTPPYRERRPPELERIAGMIANTPAAGFVGCARAIVGIDFLDRLPAISVPTLVIAGADDPATPVSAARDIHERIPGAELVVIDDAAHLANVEQPEAFNQALVGFLAKL
jgi:3-oxoadipate enol-lactonase